MADPNDGKGLLKAAIRDDDPVIFLESEIMYNDMGEVSDEADYVLPLGRAIVKHPGTDVTVISFSAALVLSISLSSGAPV